MPRIAFVYLPHFLYESYLLQEGLGHEKPLVLLRAESEQSTIVDFQPGLEKLGIRKGRRKSDYRALQEKLSFVSTDLDFSKTMNLRLSRLLGDFCPRVERCAPGQFFLDLSGTERVLGPGNQVLERVREAISRRLGYPWVYAAIAASSLAAQLAAFSLSEDYYLLDLEPGAERAFIDSRSLFLLPGVDSRVKKKLSQQFELSTIGHLRRFTLGDLQQFYGEAGKSLYFLLQGQWPGAFSSRLSIEKSSERDIALFSNDAPRLRRCLKASLAELSSEFRMLGQRPLRVHVRIDYEDDYRYQKKSLALGEAAEDESMLFDCLWPLVEEALGRRCRLKRMHLSFFRMVSPQQQRSFFDEERQKRQRLYRSLDRIKNRLGQRAVQPGFSLKEREG